MAITIQEEEALINSLYIQWLVLVLGLEEGFVLPLNFTLGRICHFYVSEP